MFWKIVLTGSDPSGRILAVLCARTGKTIDSVRDILDSPTGIVLQTGITRERAQALSAELPHDGSVRISIQRDDVACVPVLMGYRPGSRGRLRTALQKLSHLPTEEVIRFLARIPIALRTDADRATAESIKNILERAGGIVEIRSPGDLAGVSGRGKSPFSPHAATVLKKAVDIQPSASPEPKLHDAAGDSPPAAADNAHPSLTEKDSLPAVINFDPPAVVQATAPPVVYGRIDTDIDKEAVRRDPYSIKFTVPAVVIPAVVSGDLPLLTPPEPVTSMRTVLIYLHPVAPEERERVQGVLSEFFGFSQDKAERLIRSTPVALAGFSERIDALVTLSELADHGIPVSLVPGYSSSSLPTGDTSPGASLFGWLNGYERTS